MEDDLEELGFLDYRELVEENTGKVSAICFVLTDAMCKHNDALTTNAKRLHSCTNTSQAKGIMISTAKSMDDLSNIFETNTPLLRASFFNMIDNATKMKSLVMSNSEENMQDEYNAISTLLKSISEAKSGCIGFRDASETLPRAEKTINKAKKRLSNNLANIIDVLDECISKGHELLRSVI